MEIKEWIDKLSDAKLSEEIDSMNQLINSPVCCYGVKDVILRDKLEQEWDRRTNLRGEENERRTRKYK